MKRLKVRGSATSLFSIMKGSNCPLTTAIDSYLLTEKDDEGRKKLADEVTGQMNFGSNIR